MSATLQERTRDAGEVDWEETPAATVGDAAGSEPGPERDAGTLAVTDPVRWSLDRARRERSWQERQEVVRLAEVFGRGCQKLLPAAKVLGRGCQKLLPAAKVFGRGCWKLLLVPRVLGRGWQKLLLTSKVFGRGWQKLLPASKVLGRGCQGLLPASKVFGRGCWGVSRPAKVLGRGCQEVSRPVKVSGRGCQDGSCRVKVSGEGAEEFWRGVEIWQRVPWRCARGEKLLARVACNLRGDRVRWTCPMSERYDVFLSQRSLDRATVLPPRSPRAQPRLGYTPN